MAENKPWWDIGHQAQRVGFQLGRLGNSFNQHHGYGVATDPNQYDVWGVKKQPTYDPAKGPLSLSAYDSGTPASAPAQPRQQAAQSQGQQPVIDMSQSLYANALKAKQQEQQRSIQGTPTATNNMNLSGIAGILKANQDAIQENRARENQLWTRMEAQANPYDTTGEAFRGMVSTATNRANRSMAGAEARMQGALAGRGMMGSGHEASALSGLAAQRGALVSDTQGQLYADAYQKGGQWEQEKLRGMAAMLAGDYSGTINALGNLAQLPGILAARDQANEGLRLGNAGQRTQNAIAEVELKYADEIKKAGLSANQVRQKMAEYELSDIEWDRANPVQAFLRDLATSTAEGLGQAAGKFVASKIGG